jgi:hypothetical protein
MTDHAHTLLILTGEESRIMRETPNPKAWSYSLKHEVERWRPGTYVKDDAFRIAARQLGFGDGKYYRMRLKPRNRLGHMKHGETLYIPWGSEK